MAVDPAAQLAAALDRLPADSLARRYVAHGRRRELSTRGTLLRWARQLAQLQDELGAVPLHAATGDQLDAWWDRVNLRRLEPTTRRAHLAHVRGFYRWLVRQDVRRDDPTARLVAPKVPQWSPRDLDALTVRQALAALDAQRLDDPRAARTWLALALAGVGGGLRAGEVARVRREDVRRRDGRRVLRVVGKGRKPRHVTLDQRVAAALLACPPGPVFPSRDDPAQPVSANAMSQRLRRAMRAAGLPGSAHRLRHTYATALYLASGQDVLAVRDALGHASVEQTARYVAAAGVPSSTARAVWRGPADEQAAAVDVDVDQADEPPGRPLLRVVDTPQSRMLALLRADYAARPRPPTDEQAAALPAAQ